MLCAEPAFEFPFESCTRSWPDSPAGTMPGRSPGGSRGVEGAGPLLIVRLPPVEAVSPYVSPEIAPDTPSLTQRWDGDDSVPGSFDSSNDGVRSTFVYVYDKTLSGFKESTIELLIDYQNLVSYRSIGLLGVALGTSGTLANTPLDAKFIAGTTSTSPVTSPIRAVQDFKMFGNGMNTIPVFVVAAFSGPFLEESVPAFGPIGQWGNRSIQAMLAAGPTELFFNQALGSSRPVAGEGSKWCPFHDSHGVSGHAFMGAIPFLTAASMTDNYAAKATLFLLSFGAGWSRIHDDQHYLSEVLIGCVHGLDRRGCRQSHERGPERLHRHARDVVRGTPAFQFAFNF